MFKTVCCGLGSTGKENQGAKKLWKWDFMNLRNWRKQFLRTLFCKIATLIAVAGSEVNQVFHVLNRQGEVCSEQMADVRSRNFQRKKTLQTEFQTLAVVIQVGEGENPRRGRRLTTKCAWSWSISSHVMSTNIENLRSSIKGVVEGFMQFSKLAGPVPLVCRKSETNWRNQI